MVYNSNPLVVCPEQAKVAAGLSGEDLFTVVSDHFLTGAAESFRLSQAFPGWPEPTAAR
jgi:hypothetical protein